MICVKEVDRSFLSLYDTVEMNVDVHSIYRVELLDGGLGGLRLVETPVEPSVKDLSRYDRAADYESTFDIATWRFFMAFDGDEPVGAATLSGPTPNLNMLSGRTDACVLWDIRVIDRCKGCGLGQQLFDSVVHAAKQQGYRQMIIESQNNNVRACRFYRRQGAYLGKVDRYAYYDDPDVRDEVQLIWYLDL